MSNIKGCCLHMSRCNLQKQKDGENEELDFEA